MADSSPADILRRILRLSGINGWSVTLAASLGTIVSLAMGDLIGALTGAIVASGGIMEIRGRRALLRGNATGMTNLFRAQLVVLMMLSTYAVTRLLTFDAATVVAGLPAEILAMMQESGMDAHSLAQLLSIANVAVYSAVMLASLIYQGGLALYYRHRAPMVAQALSGPPPIEAKP